MTMGFFGIEFIDLRIKTWSQETFTDNGFETQIHFVKDSFQSILINSQINIFKHISSTHQFPLKTFSYTYPTHIHMIPEHLKIPVNLLRHILQIKFKSFPQSEEIHTK